MHYPTLQASVIALLAEYLQAAGKCKRAEWKKELFTHRTVAHLLSNSSSDTKHTANNTCMAKTVWCMAKTICKPALFIGIIFWKYYFLTVQNIV